MYLRIMVESNRKFHVTSGMLWKKSFIYYLLYNLIFFPHNIPVPKNMLEFNFRLKHDTVTKCSLKVSWRMETRFMYFTEYILSNNELLGGRLLPDTMAKGRRDSLADKKKIKNSQRCLLIKIYPENLGILLQ